MGIQLGKKSSEMSSSNVFPHSKGTINNSKGPWTINNSKGPWTVSYECLDQLIGSHGPLAFTGQLICSSPVPT
jgi:hypothetical protein